MTRTISITEDPAWAERIVDLSVSMAAVERCNAGAVAAGNFEMSVPSFTAVKAFMAEPTAMVIIVHEEDVLDAYLIVRRDQTRGGCQGKWVGMSDAVPVSDRTPIYTAMLDVAAHNFGWVWGRVTNAALRQFLEEGIPEGAIDPNDAEVITYKRP